MVEEKEGRGKEVGNCEHGAECCAQQTGMHILVVEALLIATFLSEGRANTFKILQQSNESQFSPKKYDIVSLSLPLYACQLSS